MATLLLHSITPDKLYAKIREIIREELKQDQLLTIEGALKMASASKATFMKAINEGTIKPQLVKDSKRAIYLESDHLAHCQLCGIHPFFVSSSWQWADVCWIRTGVFSRSGECLVIGQADTYTKTALFRSFGLLCDESSSPPP